MAKKTKKESCCDRCGLPLPQMKTPTGMQCVFANVRKNGEQVRMHTDCAIAEKSGRQHDEVTAGSKAAK